VTPHETHPDRTAPPRSFRRRIHTALHSLALKVALILAGTLALAGTAFTYLGTEASSVEWTEAGYRWADRTTDLVKRSTHYGMLQNEKEDVHQIIRRIAEGPGVEGIRIYDKQGVIIFSADEGEIGDQVDRQAEACVGCHAGDGEALEPAQVPTRSRVVHAADGHRILGLITPIENEPACATGGCHLPPEEQTVLGVLDVKVSLEWMDRMNEQGRKRQVVAGLLLVMLIGGLAAILVYRVVRRPVKALVEGTQRVAAGDLNTRIELDSKDELGELAGAFNGMTAELSVARQELTSWSARLEQKVKETTEELGLVQRQVVHMEKMASLGKLSATVAHELNNPLAGILTYAKLTSRGIREDDAPTPEAKAELLRYLDVIAQESRRCGEIVKNLLLFARGQSAELSATGLNGIVDRAALLLRHHFEVAGVELEVQPCEGDDSLICDANKIQQALVALMVNAVEAMPEGGKLWLRALPDGDGVRIEVEDTGTGIPPDVLPHIFEPFFSTKQAVNGVGLGLSVVYGIVQGHGGRIDVDSTPGRGTTFRVWLPRQAPAVADGDEAAAVAR
jgi:two-component system NtrC family sensor kinase